MANVILIDIRLRSVWPTNNLQFAITITRKNYIGSPSLSDRRNAIESSFYAGVFDVLNYSRNNRVEMVVPFI